MSIRRVLSVLTVGALIGAVAPAAHAATTTPLGSCSTPGVVKLERFGVPGTVRLNADGTPRGQLGITVRNGYSAANGFTELFIEVDDLSTGRPVPSRGLNSVDCKRVVMPLSEVTLGAKLQRGHLYLVQVSAAFSDFNASTPLTAINELLFGTQRTLFLAV